MPERRWVMGQTWTDLLFAHWRVPPAALERVMPPELPLDTFGGSAWLGVTPFGVRDLRRTAWDLLLQPRRGQRSGRRGRPAPLPAPLLPRADGRRPRRARGAV